MINNHLPHLYYFYSVAQEQSFSAAAVKLRISQSAVSLQIARLEEKLGLDLFHREGRREVTLTKAGEELWQLCQEIFSKLETSPSLGQQSNQNQVEILHITAPALFGTYLFLPFIKLFEKRHPHLKIAPLITDRMVDLTQEKIDIALRWKIPKVVKPKDQLMHQAYFGFIASKSYLAQAPQIKTSADLQRQTLITYGENHIVAKQWQILLPKKERYMPERILVIDNSLSQLEAVTQGFGLTIMPSTVLNLARYKKSLRAVLPHLRYQVSIYGCLLPQRHKSKSHELFLSEFKNYLNTNITK